MWFQLPRELSEGMDQPGPLPSTKPGTGHTASHPGDNLRGNCSNSATCFPRPQPPLVPAHWGPHSAEEGVGGGERTGLWPAVQGHLAHRHRALCPARPGAPRGSPSPCLLSLGLPQPGACSVAPSLGCSGPSLQGEKVGPSSPEAWAIYLLGPQGGPHRAGPQKCSKGNRNK